ncbi:MAG: hypothetical protein ACRDAU_01450 [Clostridium sp.]
MREIRMNLMELIVLNGDENLIKELEKRAEIEYIFAGDNGKEIRRKPNESLGEYIDRCSVGLMKNFSRKKYEKLRMLCTEYNRFGDSKIVEEAFVINETPERHNNIVERMTIIVENILGGKFKNLKKKLV